MRAHPCGRSGSLQCGDVDACADYNQLFGVRTRKKRIPRGHREHGVKKDEGTCADVMITKRARAASRRSTRLDQTARVRTQHMNVFSDRMIPDLLCLTRC